MQPSYLETAQGRKIAYHKTEGIGPGVVFLGGYVSDMEGTKALYLENWAKAQGRAFLRFDYSGHGQSSGVFEEGCIGEWADDAAAAITELTSGAQILVGSSMGGWMSLLMSKRMPEKICGFVGIAAAPDFTEDSMWTWMSDAQKAELNSVGHVKIASDYDDPYTVTKKLIDEGRNQLVLRAPLPLPFPVRLLHGTADVDVEISVALALLDHATGSDIQLTLVKDVDHRFSTEAALSMIEAAIVDVTAAQP